MCKTAAPRYVVLTARVPGPGKIRRVAIVETDGTKVPTRIDLRQKCVKSIWIEKNHGPESFDAALAAADQLCAHLNDPQAVRRYACPKCGGTGEIPQFESVANGVCFACGGKGDLNTQQQWANLYHVYRDGDEDFRRKLKWVYEATTDQFAKMSDEQVKTAVAWIEQNLSGKFVVPAFLAKRYEAIMDAQPKPF